MFPAIQVFTLLTSKPLFRLLSLLSWRRSTTRKSNNGYVPVAKTPCLLWEEGVCFGAPGLKLVQVDAVGTRPESDG